MIVLDTSALIYWTLDPDKISDRARRAMEQDGHFVISSISIWEIALKVSRGSLEIPLSTPNYLTELSKLTELEIRPVEAETWLENVRLDWTHRDPADRTIVALARQLQCPLISSDQIIAAFYPETIW